MEQKSLIHQNQVCLPLKASLLPLAFLLLEVDLVELLFSLQQYLPEVYSVELPHLDQPYNVKKTKISSMC